MSSALRNFKERAALLSNLSIPIIPLGFKSKNPVTSNGVLAATLDPQTINQWAKERPNGNAGACASYDSCWFIDDDAGTLHTYVDLPQTMKVKTSRGFHYYFLHDELSRAVRYGRSENCSIDIEGFKGEARCNKQYVVGPGSIHPSGTIYELIDETKPVPAPKRVLDWLQKAHLESETKKGRIVKTKEPKVLDPNKKHLLVKGPPPDEGFKLLAEAVGHEPLIRRMNAMDDERYHDPDMTQGAETFCPIPPHSEEDGGGVWMPCFGPMKSDEHMYKCFVCGWAGDIIKAVQTIDGLDTAYEAARVICQEENLNFDDYFEPPKPPTPKQDEQDFVDISVWETYEHDKKKAEELSEKFIEKAEAPPGKKEKPKTPPIVLTVDDAVGFTTESIPVRKALLEPFLYEKTLGMIHAYRGVGKTFVGLGMALAMASGDSFLKWNSPEPSPVLYVDGEMADEDMQIRIRQMMNPNLKTGMLTLVLNDRQKEGGIPSLLGAVGQRLIEEQLKPGATLFLDNVSTLFTGGDEKDGGDWEAASMWFLKLRREGHAVVLFHHDGKNKTQRGTSKREDILNWVLHLREPHDYDSSKGLRCEAHFEKTRRLFESQPFMISLHEGVWSFRDMTDETAAEAYRLHVEEHESLSSIAKTLAPAGETRSKAWAQKLVNKHRAAIHCGTNEEAIINDILGPNSIPPPESPTDVEF
jgi:hypothetical protein